MSQEFLHTGILMEWDSHSLAPYPVSRLMGINPSLTLPIGSGGWSLGGGWGAACLELAQGRQ